MGLTRWGRGGSDSELLGLLRGGDAGAWETFLRRWGPLLLSIVQRLFERRDVEKSFVDLARRIHAGNCACFADWKPGLDLHGYLTFKAIDLLAARLILLLSQEGTAGWLAFEHFYGADIARVAAGRARLAALDADEALDLAQDVKLRLMEHRGAAIRRYDGRGSLSGFVRVAVRNLLEDLLRERLGRRREPEPVQKLDPLARQLYRLLHIEHHRADQLGDLVRDASGMRLPEAVLSQALARLDAAIPAFAAASGRPRPVGLTLAADGDGERERPLPVVSPSPEDVVIADEERRNRERVLDALAQALAGLPEEARAYLQYRFLADPPLPPRRIADEMGLSVEDLYRLRGRWEGMLRAELRRRSVENFPVPSVS